VASILLSRLVGALLGLLRLHLSEQYLTFVSEAEALDAVVRLVPVRAMCKLAPDISKRDRNVSMCVKESMISAV